MWRKMKMEDLTMDRKIEEIHKMAQIALGKQVDKNCTKWAIAEGLFDNFEALYDAGYRKESATAKEILIPLMEMEKQIDPLKTGIRWSALKGFCKKYGIKES